MTACGEANEDPASEALPTFDDLVEWYPPLILREDGDALVAFPNLRSDPLGGWLYWDGGVPQVRRYDESGLLSVAIGRSGEGPGEFSEVVAFMRTAKGELVSVDRRGRVATWDDGGELVHEFSVGFAPVAGALPIRNGILLFSSFGSTFHSDALGWMYHLDTESRTLSEVASAPRLQAEYAGAAMRFGGPQARAFGGSIFVGLSVVDTVWAWREDDLGKSPVRMSVPSESLRGNTPPPPAGPDSDPFLSWFEESWFLGDFVRLTDGRWLYQVWASRGNEMRGRLLLADERGEPLWETDANFRILDVDEDGRVYLWDPNGSNPATVLVARVK
jgi:hypothetical protein